MEKGFPEEAARKLGCHILRDEPMSRHTTFRIGGPADWFVTLETEEQLRGLLPLLEERDIPWTVLGNGSNLLVSDKGIRGAVLWLDGQFKEISLLPDGVTVRAGAGALLSAACAFARDHSLSGLEFAWGIPGSVGGAVYMNAGAYGGEVKDVLSKAHSLSGEEVSGSDPRYGYRHSPFTGGKDIICFADFLLGPGDRERITESMDDLMGRRKEKQPYNMPSAGSVFKRPKTGYAAVLIDECGLKGRRVGGAQVSEKHAGFIVNTGGATCADVLELIAIIQREVLGKKGISLECEVRVTGEL